MTSISFRFFSFFTLLLISGLSLAALGQQQPQGKDINAGSFSHETSYSPILADPVKIDFAPTTVKPDTVKPVLKYFIQPKLLNLPFVPPDIHPIAMVKEDIEPTQNNLLKLGFGTQFTPYGELYLNTGRSNQYDAGIYAYHLSGSGNMAYQKFSDNILQLNGEKFFKTSSLSAQLRYDRNAFEYYGYNRDSTEGISNSSLKQIFTKLSGGLDFTNTKKNKSFFDYDWHVGFYNLTDNYKANESNFNTYLDLGKQYEKIHHFNLRIGVDLNSFKQDSLKSNVNLFHISPSYRIQTDNYKATIGFDVVPNSEGNPFFLPILEGQYNVVGEYFSVFAGAKGDVNKNNFETLTAINPFLNPEQQQTYDKKYDIHLGVKGSAGNNVFYLLKVSDRIYDNLPMFYSDTNRIRGFNVVYEENASEFNLHGEIGYKEAEHINIIFSADYYKYKLDFNDTALGYPTGKLSLQVDYNIQHKIILGANIFAFSQSFTKVPIRTIKGTNPLVPEYETVALKGDVDLNLSIQYNYKKNFGLFVNVNNIASSKYQRWYNYPSYGFNLVAGLIVKF